MGREGPYSGCPGGTSRSPLPVPVGVLRAKNADSQRLDKKTSSSRTPMPASRKRNDRQSTVPWNMTSSCPTTSKRTRRSKKASSGSIELPYSRFYAFLCALYITTVTVVFVSYLDYTPAGYALPIL
jgi:hypothetical protein